MTYPKFLLLALLSAVAAAQAPSSKEVESAYPDAHALYLDLHQHPGASFGKVQMELANPWFLAFYIAGLLCAAWHFAYGIWLFFAKWGITVGERARQKFLFVCMALFLLISIVGLLSLRSFVAHPQQPISGAGAQAIETGDVR